ncbi:MAG TPA: DMT family transporter [Steroidobacteraceae bacterium]|nr:DMT family transporter [Steroidobacteraceae bacterium]
MAPERKALLQIHLCVVLWGFTAILGKLITLPALALVWWRMLLVAVAAALLPRFWRGLAGMDARTLAIFSGIGAVVALHWLSFYGAIKLSNASVAATCMAVTPVLTALVEPWLTRTRFDPRDLLVGILAVPGVALVAGGTPPAMRLGLAAGLLSAVLVSVFGVLNKRYVHHGEPLTVTGVELAAGALVLTAVGALTPGWTALPPWPGLHDAVLLIVLALACTLFPFWLSLIALKHLSAFSTQLAVSLEPVYAIVLAIVLLGEQHELGAAFYLGVAIILAAVFIHTVRKVRAAPAA